MTCGFKWSLMKKRTILGIEVNDAFYGCYSICSSLCPYETISVDASNGKAGIDVGRCQFSRVCYSAYPIRAIETVGVHVLPLHGNRR